jgi:hypothetical protein
MCGKGRDDERGVRRAKGLAKAVDEIRRLSEALSGDVSTL